MKVRVPASAPATPPETGASSIAQARAAAAACDRAGGLDVDRRAVDQQRCRAARGDDPSWSEIDGRAHAARPAAW